MKKITLLFIFLATSLGFSQNGGDSCSTAVAISPGSFTNTAIAVGTSGGEGGGGSESSAWFSYTATADGTIDVSSCGVISSDTRLYVGSGTCGSLILTESDDDCTSGLRSEILAYPVFNGTTYYIEWDDRWEDTAFDWSLTFNAPPSCSVPTNISFDYFDNDQLDFSWDDALFGPPTGYDWEIVPDGNAQGVGVVVSGSVTSPTNSATTGATLSITTAYDLYIRTDCGGGSTSAYVGPFSFTTLAGEPIANDLCSGAGIANQEGNIATAASATAVAGTIENAVSTSDPSDCFGGGNTNDDVWYRFTALTADITITVDSGFDCGITIYSTSDDSCGTLTELDCVDDVFGVGEELNRPGGLNIGSVYYFRVYQYSGGIPADPTFTYKLWSSAVLDVNQIETENEFSYFPNPVNDKLSLRAQSAIQNVAIYNMLGQEVLRTTPNSLASEFNMSELSNGAYFVQVTINNTVETIRIIKK